MLVLTTFDLDEYVFGALRAGAGGFLLKDTDAGGLVDAVRTVARGDGILAPTVTRRLITAFATRARPPSAGPRSSTTSPPASATCWPASAGACPTRRSPTGWRWRRAPRRPTSAGSWRSSDLRSRVQAAILAQEASIVLDDGA